MMGKHSKLEVFGKEAAMEYDRRNSHLVPILKNLHYLIRVLFSELAPNSKVLCVGVGTGREIIELAETFPEFTFVGVDTSESMLEVCRDELQKLKLLDRCQLIHGSIESVPRVEDFDAALCLLVLHHASVEERVKIVAGVAKCLKSSGYFVCAELSFDMITSESDDLLEKWKSLIRHPGISEDKIQRLPQLMKDHLFVQSPSEVEHVLMVNGFLTPIQFFQSLLIRAWYSRK